MARCSGAAATSRTIASAAPSTAITSPTSRPAPLSTLDRAQAAVVPADRAGSPSSAAGARPGQAHPVHKTAGSIGCAPWCRALGASGHGKGTMLHGSATQSASFINLQNTCQKAVSVDSSRPLPTTACMPRSPPLSSACRAPASSRASGLTTPLATSVCLNSKSSAAMLPAGDARWVGAVKPG